MTILVKTIKKFSEEFTKKNAKQEIPLLEIDGIEITQSVCQLCVYNSNS